MSQASKVKRTLTGRVISNKMDKTINVSIERKVKHPKYGKYLKRSSKILAHDPENQCQEGDTVIIQEGRPISKRKAWSLVQVVVKSINQQPVPEETAG
ncbi:30S ribosomal protein S17 [Rickettsiella endosymbiont of Miltochrista miniata]|uniref:30S ribosomal protein S17 n=1 Tax=Rickettsiella endosymbiont of Miltochrista miniata TaxID=3066239 RepID=UPI00313D7E32